MKTVCASDRPLMRSLSFLAKKCGLRVAALLAVAAILSGCGIFKTKSKITVPQLLTPLVEADTSMLIGEINRLATVRSLSGRIDITFLDTTFAECGVADLYRTADGRVIVQRPGQIYLLVQAPFEFKIAEMSSNGDKFWAALYQGDEKYKRFVTGTNRADYEKLAANGNGVNPDCRKDGKRQEAAMQRATVSALSSLRPQHLADALLVPSASTADSGDIYYSRHEAFEEEPDTRDGAKKGTRVVRGYYILSELKVEGPGRARQLRRFWFDRVGSTRLARVQTYNERGQLITDVVYGQPTALGGSLRLPAQVELTRPQERYSLRIAFQDPSAVKVDQMYPADAFVLKNESRLPEVDLDAPKKP